MMKDVGTVGGEKDLAGSGFDVLLMKVSAWLFIT